MLLHKLHVHQWLHILRNLDQLLGRMDGEYQYTVQDSQYLKETLREVEKFKAYLNKVNVHLLEQGNKLTHVKQEILKLEEGPEHHAAQKIAEDKKYYEEQFPKLLQALPAIENEFQRLEANMKQLHKSLSTGLDGRTLSETRQVARRIIAHLETVESISRVIAGHLRERYKHIKLEMADLKEEGNMVHHLDHNIESWFMH